MLRLLYRSTDIPKSSFSFRMKYTYDNRETESNRILAKHKGKIPVVIEKNEKSNVPELDKYVHIIAENITIAQILLLIRKKVKLQSSDSLFLTIGNYEYIPGLNENLKDLYEKYKDPDGFLYLMYSKLEAHG